MKGFLPGLILLGVVSVGAAWYLAGQPALPEEAETLEGLGFSLAGMSDFTVTHRFGSSEREDQELNITATKGDDVLRVKVLSNQSQTAAERAMTGRSILLEAQYDSRLPPYPEFLTNSTGCADRFLPQKKKAREGMYYLVNADGRFNYGLCADDLIHYKAGFGLFYCERSSKVFQIEYFTNKERAFDDVEKLISSFACTT